MSSVKFVALMALLLTDSAAQTRSFDADECLTGKFVDIQSWVGVDGRLNKRLNLNVTVDLSGQPDRIGQIFEIVADQWQHNIMQRRAFQAGTLSDEVNEQTTEEEEYDATSAASIDPRGIKYMSLAKCNLARIPLASTDNRAEGDPWNRDAPWRNLRYLSLFGNYFGKSWRPAEAAKSGSKVSYSMTINATSCIETVPEKDSLFYYPDRSTWAEDLASIDLSGLIELDLRNCSIEVLDDNTFASAPILEKLYLSHNSIFQIYALAFNGLRSLIHLDLSRNSILKTSINETLVIEGMTILRGAFVPLTSLRSLDFSFTRIVQTCVTVFDQLNFSMERLSLCYTGFPSIRRGMFSNTGLKYLDISGNIALEDLSSEAFKGIEDTLLILYAKRLGIRSVQSVINLIKLEVLALNDNDITDLDGNETTTLKNLQNLKILDLTNNRISSWQSRIFLNMPHLDLLILKKNSLSLLSIKMLHDMHNIKFLSFASNSLVCTCILRHVMDRVLENESDRLDVLKQYPSWYQKHARINDSDNIDHDMHGVTKSVIFQNAYRHYSVLILKGSVQFMPLKNSYSKKNIGERYFPIKSANGKRNNEKLKNMKVLFSSMWYPEEKSNANSDAAVDVPTPEEVFNFTFRLFDYSEQNYRCTDSKSNAPWTFDNITECGSSEINEKSIDKPAATMSDIILILTIISAILIGCLVLAWKWWYVRCFFVMVKNAAMLSILGKEGPNIVNENEYTYDVFVSYCEDDRPWVLEELLPEIENNASISVCLHERDFQVGLSILENIISCMDRSRALLMVVSNQFLLSQWCQFEMYLAQHRLLETRREQLILVLLEDIPRRRRPTTLHYLMMTKTYIVWPKVSGEKAAFWKRLKKSIMYGKCATTDRGSSMA